MLDPATARLCVWRLPLEAAFRLFSKLGSLGGSIRERFSRTGRTRPALARPAFSRWLLENDRLRERWPCQWLNVLYFPFSETSPCQHRGRCPHPRSPRGRGAGENLLHPYHRALGRLQPVKAKPQAVASQALTGFQLRPLRIVLLLSRRWRGVKGGEAVHFTLDALEPTQHFATGSGGWVLTACPLRRRK